MQTATNKDDRLIVALDVPDVLSGLDLAQRLGDSVSFYKIGLGMLTGGALRWPANSRPNMTNEFFLTSSSSTSPPRLRQPSAVSRASDSTF